MRPERRYCRQSCGGPAMQAWRVHRNGEPSEVMRLEEVDRPTPGDGQVLLKVRAANINFPDALLCRGQYQVRPPLPFTPGVEICGETEDGRRVIANPAPAVRRTRRVRRRGRRGRCCPRPEALDDAEAAALHIGYQTGWFGLHRRAAPPGGRDPARARRGGRRRQRGRPARQGRRRHASSASSAGRTRPHVARELGCDVVIDRRARGHRRRASRRPPAAAAPTSSTTRSAATPTPSPPSASPSRAGS